MKLRVTLVLSGALALSVSALPSEANAGPAHVLAQKKKAPAAKPSADGKAPAIKKKIGLAPRGVAWGISHLQLAKIYDKVFEKQFVPLYKKTSPGPRMEALDAELEQKKLVLRNNWLTFGMLPTGIDQTQLKGEYSYGNNEGFTRVTLRTGVTRNFFFFNDKLWLVYDEHKLRPRGPYGASFEEAVKLLTKRLGGVAPQMLEPDYANGRNFAEARWLSANDIVIRAIDRGNTLGMAYANGKVFYNLRSYRKNRPPDAHAIDKDVAAATAKKPPPDPKADAKDKKKKK